MAKRSMSRRGISEDTVQIPIPNLPARVQYPPPVHLLVSIRSSCKNSSCLCYLNKMNTYSYFCLQATHTCSCVVHIHTLCWNIAIYWDCVCMIFKQSKRNLAIASRIRTLHSALKKREKSTLLTWLRVPIPKPACVANLASQNNIKTVL